MGSLIFSILGLVVAKWLLYVQASHLHCRQEEKRNVNDTRVCSSGRFLFLVRKKHFYKCLLIYHPGLYHVATSRVLGTLQHRFLGSIKEEGKVGAFSGVEHFPSMCEAVGSIQHCKIKYKIKM